jgi:ABC-2 type transport system permease protein
MKLLRIKAIAKKEWIQIRRDPFSLAMAFLMPAILLFIYGYAITFDIDSISTIVYDQDKSSLSRELVAEFRESRYFRIISYVEQYGDIDPYLDGGRAKVALVIPYDFSKNVRKQAGAPRSRSSLMEVIQIQQPLHRATSLQYQSDTGKGSRGAPQPLS